MRARKADSGAPVKPLLRLALTSGVLTAALLNASVGLAGEWTSSAGISVSEIYTDNVCLDEAAEFSRWVTTATPNFTLEGSGGRTSASISASFQANNLDEEDQQRCSQTRSGSGTFADNVDNFNPRVSANGQVELIRNFAFVDASASVQQNKADPFQSGGNDSINLSANQNTSYNYAISPYVTWRVGGLAVVDLRYSYDTQTNSDDRLEDSDSQTGSVSINSAGGSPFTWGLQGNYQKVDYDESEIANQQTEQDDELGSASINLGYQLSRRWRINGSWGEDFNDYQSANEEIDGEFWNASLSWTPTDRFSIELGAGERYFGDDNSVSIQYRHKRSEFSLEYGKNITYSRSLRVDDPLQDLRDASGNVIDPITGLPIALADNLTTDTRSPILDERASMAYSLVGTRTSINLRASHSKQIREEDNEESEFTNYSVSLERRVSRYFTLNAGYDESEREAVGDNSRLGEDSKTKRADLGIQYTLGPRTSMSLNYTQTERTSESIKDIYEENRVTVSVNMDLK